LFSIYLSYNVRYKKEDIMKFDQILEEVLLEYLVKKEDGYHIMSKKGKHLGGPYSKKRAVKRLRQIEYFKNQ